MALTYSNPPNAPTPTAIVRSGALGGLRVRFKRITTDAFYTTGGYTLTAANFGLDVAIVFIVCNEGVSGFCPTWDSTNQKMKFFKVGAAGPSTEAAANEAGLNGAVFDFMVFGF